MFIKNDTRPYLSDLVVYKPKVGGLNQNPPVIHHSLSVTIYSDELLNFQCVAENGPVTFTTTEKPDWITASSTGLFSGDPFFAGVYNVYFYVSNSFGPVYYSLVVNVIDRPILELDYFLLTEGYSALPGDEDGFLLQTDEIDEEQKIIIKSPEPLYYLGTSGYSNLPGGEDGFILHTEETGEEEQKIIVFDEVGPPFPAAQGNVYYYIPTGDYSGYKPSKKGIFTKEALEVTDFGQGIPNPSIFR